VAIDDALGIGKDGGIPWHFKEDMQFFAKTTKGSTCIMGRKTYDSMVKVLGERKALLKGRQSIVVSRNPELITMGAELAKSLPEALKLATNESIFLIGGESIYTDGLSFADHVYITRIPGYYRCDVSLTGIFDSWRANSVGKDFKIETSQPSELGSSLIYECYKRKQNEI